jgi:hypothetical protein
MNMSKTFWKNPVDVRLAGANRIRTITSSAFAFECLTTLWPDAKHGPLFYRAILACYDAQDGKIGHEAARSAFVSAAGDASLLYAASNLARSPKS